MRTLIAALLRLFPTQFRKHYGAELLATFEERWRDGHGWRLAMRTIVDLARSAFLEHVAERHRQSEIPSSKGDRFTTTLGQDVRFGVRTLRKTPGFTFAAVVTLALGIGANSAIYSVVDAVLLKGLPYPHAERLVFINEALPNAPAINAAWPDFQDWRAQNQVFSDMAVFQPQSHQFQSAGGSQIVAGGLGVRFVLPAAGRSPHSWAHFRPAGRSPRRPARGGAELPFLAQRAESRSANRG